MRNLIRRKRLTSAILSFIMVANSGVAFANDFKNKKNPINYTELADFNKDNKIDSKDFGILQDFILNKIDEIPSREKFGTFSVGDLNGDYEITSTDLAILNRYLNGSIDQFEVAGKIVVNVKEETILLYEGQRVELPSTILATMYDETQKDLSVIWSVDEIDFSHPGEYQVFGNVNGYGESVKLNVIVKAYDPNINVVSGVVKGIDLGDKAIVTIGNEKYLSSTEVDNHGVYQFEGIPNGEYFVKLDLTGYKLQQSQQITVSSDKNSRESFNNIGQANFEVEKFTDDKYTYHWEQDETVGGYEESAYIANKPKIEFLEEEVVVGDSNASNKLLHSYNIILSDEELSWSQEYSHRLWETIESIPQVKTTHNGIVNKKPSKWILTDKHIDDDIHIQYGDDGDIITISKDAFINATPRLAEVDDIKGEYYSKKLHFALVRYITKEGTDIDAVEKILNERFGVTTLIPSYEELTKYTTQEDEYRFQQFKPDELMYIINVFEEMPQGFYKVKGLRYLVRRSDGMKHPMYPTAPAVAWPDALEESYIEFMDDAFIADDSYIHRLIIHEKAHFMWSNLFNEDIKNNWIEIGGWYENPDDPDGWSTTKTTEFVSDYAHGKNPNEDMAETIAYYIINPDKLKSRSISKYEFVRDYIMHGDIYISQIREDLTFEVFNLYPDYNYPGKIKRIDIEVEGKGNEDKLVTVEIELNILNKIFDGASSAYTRIYSDVDTFYDLGLQPINEEGSILRGQIEISKYSKSGYWYTDQIVVTDIVGNQRFEGMNDFGWKLYVNNDEEDIIPPKYVANSLEINVFEEEMESRKVNRINVSWDVDENQAMQEFNGVYATLINTKSNQDKLEKWGIYDVKNNKANVDFYLTEFMQSGTYGTPYINMVDKAQNTNQAYFSDSIKDEKMKTVEIVSDNPDSTPPEIDINKIYVKATPTKPEAPDGETLVEITYYAKDDKSGLGEVSYKLRDPQGITHHQFHYHENFGTLFFNGNPTEWKEYKIKVVLPRGSAPGIWGLEEINIVDKARNRKNYNFTENIHFEVGNQTKLSGEETKQIVIGNADGIAGKEVVIPISVEGLSSEEVNNFNFALKYDSNVLKLVEINTGEIISNSEDIKSNIINDEIVYFAFNDLSEGSRTINSSGNIAYLKFMVKEGANLGKTKITSHTDINRPKDMADVNLNKINYETLEGSINILAKSNEKPVISGADDVTIIQGEEFDILKEVTASDKEDGDITSKIEVEGIVDTSKPGACLVTYKVTDSDSNTTVVERNIKVLPKLVEINNIPEIIGAKDRTIKVGDSIDLMEGIMGRDKEDGNITNQIKIIGKVNSMEIGEYPITYELTDSQGAKISKYIKVTVKSNEKPIIEGGVDVTTIQGMDFNPLKGVTAKDFEDGDLTAKLQVEGKVDSSKSGVYPLTYSVTDSDKNTATITINVTVQKSDWATHWGVSYIRKAMSNGWVDISTKFRPNDDITRAEFIKIVNKAFEYTEIGEEPFKDVYPNDWFYDDVRIAVKAGYITTSNIKFRPNDPISREEVAVIVTNILNNKDTNLDKIKEFEDYKLISPWAQTSVEGAVESGYMGVNVTRFYPISNITRAEAVTTLIRVANK